MPRIAILSDIHGNLEALTEVLKDLDTHDCDEIVCLGDIVGYGPQPQECCDLLREREVFITMGNHEQGLINIHYLAGFNQPARDSLRKTREMITEATYQWLVSHPKSVVRHGCRFVHGVPPDSVADYIWKYEKSMGDIFACFSEEVCFIGHTHDLMRYTLGSVVSDKLPLAEGDTILEADKRHLVNVGAVGQPRDGDNRAKYALFDTPTNILTMRFIPYDVEKTATLISARGFHRGFADRLR